MSHMIVVLIGLAIAVGFAATGIVMLEQNKRTQAVISFILAAVVLIGGFILSDYQFKRQCVASGGAVIVDTCYPPTVITVK